MLLTILIMPNNQYVLPKGGKIFHSFPLHDKDLTIRWVAAMKRDEFAPADNLIVLVTFCWVFIYFQAQKIWNLVQNHLCELPLSEDFKIQITLQQKSRRKEKKIANLSSLRSSCWLFLVGNEVDWPLVIWTHTMLVYVTMDCFIIENQFIQ